MRHLDDELIDLYLGGELGEADARAVLEHLAECDACGRRVEAAKDEDRDIGELLGLLDHPIPQVGAADVMRRAARRWRVSHAVAAGVALLVVAGAATAVPGSSVRTWVARLLERPQETTAEQDPAGGVSMIPTDPFELVFETSQASGTVLVTLVEEAEFAVRAIGRAPAYSVAPQGVRVENAGSTADYEIRVPRSANNIRIRVGDSIVFTKQAASIVAAVHPDAGGRYVMEFAALPR